MTRLLSAAAPDDVQAAAALLRGGRVVALPTETVYGLAGDARNEEAIAAIYAAKGRPADNPLIVHLPDASALDEVVREVPASARELAAQFWPGPLSLVLPRRPGVPDAVTAGLDTVAVRVPNHPAFQAVLRAAGVPLAAPSANRAGSPSPTTAAHVLADLDGLIPAVLDGGPSAVGVESTVLSLVGAPRLLRPGGVSREEIEAVVGPVEVDPAVTGEEDAGLTPGAPGMKYRHYSPAAPTFVLLGSPTEATAKVGPGDVVVCPAEEGAAFTGVRVITYGQASDPASLARGLFAALREADTLTQSTAARVLLRVPEDETGIGLAIRNRLLKAAGFAQL